VRYSAASPHSERLYLEAFLTSGVPDRGDQRL